MKHTGKDELQGAALRPYHQINPFQITLKRLINLGGHQQHQRHRGQPQRQQRNDRFRCEERRVRAAQQIDSVRASSGV